MQKKTLFSFHYCTLSSSHILQFRSHSSSFGSLLIEMGNCQAVDAAALVIQHPSGKIERLYWPVSASEVMRTNPGYYLSLIIPLAVPQGQNQDQKTVFFT